MTKTDGSGISNGMELPYEWEQFREHLERASAYPGASGCLGVVVLAEPDKERLFTQGKAVCPVSSAWRKAAKAAPDQTKLAVCSGPACLSSHEGVLRCWQYHFSVRGNEAFRDAFGDMLARAVRLTGRQKGAFLVNMADAVYREYPGEVCEDGLQVTYARRPSDARERNARLVRPREWVTMELRDPLGMVAMLLSSPSAQMVARVGGLNTAQGQAFLRIRTISNCLREWGTREELSSPALFGQIWAYGVHWLELIGREPVYPVPNSALVTVTEESGPPDWSKVSCDPDLLKVAQAEFRSFGALNNGEVFGLQAKLSNLATWRTPLGQAEDCGRKVLEYWPESRRSNMADLLQQLAASLQEALEAAEGELATDGALGMAKAAPAADMPGAVWTRQSGPTGSEQMEAALRKHLAQHPLDRYLLSAKKLAVACGGSETQDGVVKETNVWDAVMEDRRELARILSVGARKLKMIVEECQKQVGVKRTQEAIQNFLDSGKYTESHDLGVNYLVVRAKQISRENRERHEAPNPMGGNLDFADKERLPTEYVENLSDHPDVACEDGSLRRIQEEG